MKRNLLSRTLLLLLMVVGGVCGAWAQVYTEVYNLNCPTNSKNTAYANTYDITVGEVQWNAPGNQSVKDGGWRIGGKSLSEAVDRVITGMSPINSDVVKITFNHKGKSRAAVTVPYVKLIVASDAEYKTVIDEVTISTPSITKGEVASFDFTPTSPLTKWNSGYYYKIIINVTNSDTDNGGIDVTSIVFYNIDASKAETETNIDYSGLTNTAINTGTAAGQLTANVTSEGVAIAGATVTWESSDEDIATIDENGNVTLVAEGTTTITASYAGDDTHGASSATYELTVTDSRIDAELAYASASQTVFVGEVLDAPVLTNPNNLVVTYSSADETIATVDADGNVTGVAAGSTTITATFAGDNTYKGASVSYTIVVTKPLPKGALFWESVSNYTSGNDSSTKINGTNATNYLDSDNWDTGSFSDAYPGKNGCFKLGTSSKIGKVVTGEIALVGSGVLTFTAKQYKDSETGPLNITVSGATASGDVSVAGTENFETYTVILTNAEGHVVITFETESKRMYLDDILLIPVVSVDMSTKDYISFCSDKALDFTNVEDLEALVVTKINETSVSTKPVTTVPAGVGVILHKTDPEATSFNVPVVATATKPATNYLVGVLEATTIGGNDTDYVLKDGVFKKANAGTLAAGKAYLKTDANAAPALTIGFGDEGTTGIRSIDNGQLTIDNVYYDLSGRRVAEPTKGVYIVNGKKVVIK